MLPFPEHWPLSHLLPLQKRIVSLHLDKEDSVAVQAIKLCKHLLQRDVLEAEECLEVCELAFLENKAVSHAAGEFAVSYLFSDDFMARAKQAKVPRGESIGIKLEHEEQT